MLHQRWPVDDGVAGSALPGGVSAAAVTEAGDMTDEPWLRRENGSGIASVGPVRQ